MPLTIFTVLASVILVQAILSAPKRDQMKKADDISLCSPGMSPDYFPKDDDGDEISGGRLAEPNVFPWFVHHLKKLTGPTFTPYSFYVQSL